jgi:DNA-binding transcriptional LysR family regulator
MGDAAGRVSLAACGQAQSVEGSIRITASEIHSAFLLPPIIARIRRELPGLTVEIVASNETIDIRKREADIAVRNFRPTQPDLIARKIKDEAARFYATPAYLRRIGNPKTLADFSRADFIGFDATDVYVKLLVGRGLDVTQRNFLVLTASHPVHWELAKEGVAIGIVPESIGDREPKVVRVLDEVEPMVFPMWLTTHRELNTSRRVRVVYDLLAEELARA